MPPQRDGGVYGGLGHVVALALLRVRAVHPTRGRAEDGAERLGKSLACHRSWWLGAPHPRKTPEPPQLGTFHQDYKSCGRTTTRDSRAAGKTERGEGVGATQACMLPRRSRAASSAEAKGRVVAERERGGGSRGRGYVVKACRAFKAIR